VAQVIATFGDDLSTDVIYPGRFMATVLPEETPQFAFADDEELNQKLCSGAFPKGSVIAAGSNFGSGSSREQAASTLKGHELIIVARSFARIFIQNAINLGLQTVECPEFEGEVGHELEITPSEVINKTLNRSFTVHPLPESRRAVAEAGGLIAYTRKRILEQSSQAP
jgi:3-isopropylmalate/(R)-2-methylmalate dehydratase small subunit